LRSFAMNEPLFDRKLIAALILLIVCCAVLARM
jgi:hypothetical protein